MNTNGHLEDNSELTRLRAINAELVETLEAAYEFLNHMGLTGNLKPGIEPAKLLKHMRLALAKARSEEPAP